MEYTTFLVILLISSPCLIFPTVRGRQQKVLSNLRRYRIEGVGGRFVVNREALERELQNRKQQDAACGQDVRLQLPQSLPHSSYKVSHQGEVGLYYLTITDHTLADELPNSLKEHVATSYQSLSVGIPVIVGLTEKHGFFLLHLFTNSTKEVLDPYATNNSENSHVDTIVEEDDGTVNLRLNDDVMTLQIQEKVKVNVGKKVGKDFDKVNGKVIPATSYPLQFDWGCELLGSQVSFCQVLNDVRCELAAVGGDVCTLTSTSSSERLPAFMMIVNMTGIFREMFPFLAETVPNESFEAETLDREHTTGITYPCLTP